MFPSFSVGHSASANMGTIDQMNPTKSHGTRVDRITSHPQQSSFDRLEGVWLHIFNYSAHFF